MLPAPVPACHNKEYIDRPRNKRFGGSACWALDPLVGFHHAEQETKMFRRARCKDSLARAQRHSTLFSRQDMGVSEKERQSESRSLRAGMYW